VHAGSRDDRRARGRPTARHAKQTEGVALLHVGTSGWDYREWKPDFYPSDLSQSRFLEHYASTLAACEINTTFYRLHEQRAAARWAESVPATFRFAAKAHRRLTHRKRFALGTTGHRFLRQFFESLEPLGERLACVLFQFAPYTERDDSALAELIEALPAERPFALEFRHESWFSPDVIDRAAERGGTICLSETEGSIPERLPPGPLAYVRLRADHYAPDVRAAWLELLEREAESRNVYAFAKHRDVPADDPFTGVGLAQWLTREAVRNR
jgi:uncharacterized protein YecE (DUF72 family)